MTLLANPLTPLALLAFTSSCPLSIVEGLLTVLPKSVEALPEEDDEEVPGPIV